MGLLDDAKNLIGDVAAAADRVLEQTGSGKLALTMAKFYPGGLAAFLDRLRGAGHGDAVASWLAAGTGPETRQSVPAAAIARCLPEGVAERLAYDLGVPVGRVTVVLSEFLPAAVAEQSENGQLKPQPNFSTQVRPASGAA
jgi:uncharacterized protein YidB (DUF937 family)